MAAAMRAFFHLLNMTGYLARKRLLALALAAVLPFIASHLVVLQARQMGLPERLLLDMLHGVIVLSYLTAAVRVAEGQAVGAARFGAAIFKLSWPGFQALVRMGAAIGLIGLPLALLAHPVVQAIESSQNASMMYVPVTMLPEFVMTTLVALVIAAETVKIPGEMNP